jgi:hypothetical protein
MRSQTFTKQDLTMKPSVLGWYSAYLSTQTPKFQGTSCLHLQMLRKNLKTMVPIYKALSVASQDIYFQT